jgi:transcriptional regulator with XRE-family HTH domain
MNYKLLDNARISLKWSVQRTSDESNIPLQTVKNILSGKTQNSRMDTIFALAKALNVPIDKLFTNEDTQIIEEEVIDDMVNKVIEEKKADEISVIALKEIYEHQMVLMKEANEEHIKNIREHYERHIADLEKHYEKRLADKREHIETILLDKKWFRLASVFSVLVLLGVFFFIEFMTPGHGWFTFGK